MKSNVYFTDLRAKSESLLDKTARLFDLVGFGGLLRPATGPVKLH